MIEPNSGGRPPSTRIEVHVPASTIPQVLLTLAVVRVLLRMVPSLLVLVVAVLFAVTLAPLMRTPNPTPGFGASGPTPRVTPMPGGQKTPSRGSTEVPSSRTPGPGELQRPTAAPRAQTR